MTQVPMNQTTEDIAEGLSKMQEGTRSVPHFIEFVWGTIQRANEIAQKDSELGYIEFDVVQPKPNLTCLKATYVDVDGDKQESYFLTQISLVEESGHRRWRREGIRIQNTRTNRFVLISADAELLLSFLSF